MTRLKALLALTVLAQGVVSVALAANIVVPAEKIADPVATTFPGRSVDVLGVAPGMTVDAVTAAMAEKLPGAKKSIESVSIGMNYKGAEIRLQEYDAKILFAGSSDIMTVFFASPVIGSPVVGVIRNADFPDPFKAPTVAATVEALTAKYGKPSARRDDEKLLTLEWMLTGKGDFACPIMGSRKLPLCPATASPAEKDLHNALKAAKAEVKVAISASLFHKADADKLSSMTVVVDDFAKRLQGSDAIDTFLKAAVDKGMSNTAPAKPAL